MDARDIRPDAEDATPAFHRFADALQRLADATGQRTEEQTDDERDLQRYAAHGEMAAQATGFLTHITTTVSLYVTVTGAAWAVASSNTIGASSAALLCLLAFHIAFSIGVALGLWGMGNSLIQRLNMARWVGEVFWPSIERIGRPDSSWCGLPDSLAATVASRSGAEPETVASKAFLAGGREKLEVKIRSDGEVECCSGAAVVWRSSKPASPDKSGGDARKADGIPSMVRMETASIDGGRRVRTLWPLGYEQWRSGRTGKRRSWRIDFWLRYCAGEWPSLRYQRLWALLPVFAAVASAVLCFQVDGDGRQRRALCRQVAEVLSSPLEAAPPARDALERARHLFDKAGCPVTRIDVERLRGRAGGAPPAAPSVPPGSAPRT